MKEGSIICENISRMNATLKSSIAGSAIGHRAKRGKKKKGKKKKSEGEEE